MAYPTVTDLANYLEIPDADDHSELDNALRSAIFAVDSDAGWGAGGFEPVAASPKIFEPDSPHLVLLRGTGFVSTAGLTVKTDTTGDGTYDTTWDASDYELTPHNNSYEGVAGFPYFELCAVGDHTFPIAARGKRGATVQVSAPWGWAEMPAPAHSAIVQRAAAIHLRRKTRDGINPATGFRAGGHDRDYELLLAPVTHPWLRPALGYP